MLGLEAFLWEGGGVWRKKWRNGGVPWDKFSELVGGGRLKLHFIGLVGVPWGKVWKWYIFMGGGWYKNSILRGERVYTIVTWPP